MHPKQNEWCKNGARDHSPTVKPCGSMLPFDQSKDGIEGGAKYRNVLEETLIEFNMIQSVSRLKAT